MQVLELLLNDFDEIYTNGVCNSVDPAFRKINKTFTEFLIWKIENHGTLALTKDQYGIFNDADSYLIYSASQYGQPSTVDTVSREIKNGTATMEYHIHFWLGSTTTSDKSGVAAYKTVELDHFLGGLATQHRDSQGNESARFKSYFKNGIKILKPHLNNFITAPKLFKIKGKRCPILTQLEFLNWSSFNSSEIFLIHAQKCLFIWIGRAAKPIEKIHATKIATEFKNEHTDLKIIFVDDGYEKTLQDDFKKIFNQLLPLEQRHIMPQSMEDGFQKQNRQQVKLYKCMETSGKYRVVEIKSGPLVQSDLNTEDVFIVDHGLNGVWIWIGKKADDKEKTEALRNARGFVKKRKYPNNTKVSRTVENYEPIEFKNLFQSWKTASKKTPNAKPANSLVSKFDSLTMEERPFLAAETQLIDDGNGSATIWRIKDKKIYEIPKERHGYFFSSDCYIVLYTYQIEHKVIEEKHLLYYWLGSHAQQEDIDCTIQKTIDIDKSIKTIGFQCRINQNYETAHFMQIFKGKLVIFRGNSTDFDETGHNLKNPSQYLAQIFGSSKFSSKAVQVPPKIGSLNSNYCFVLRRGKHGHIWCGQFSTGDQREMAKSFAGKDFEIVLEGKEKEEFFALLGGKTNYYKHLIKKDADEKIPRLFFTTNSKGHFQVEEILFFTQQNLIPEDVMLLDGGETLYLWIGKLSTKEDQHLLLQTAIEYLQSDPSGRNLNMPVITVKQGFEPPTFIGYFPFWDKKHFKHYKTFNKIQFEIENNCPLNGCKNINNQIKKSGNSDFDQYDKYPVEILKEPNEKLPSNVDPLNKELHLTHDDFVSIFNMNFDEFEKVPRWKKQEMKKTAGLF